MTNYIESLKKELSKRHFSEAEKEDIINDHEEMIKEAIADGLDENDLEERFGSPEQVARDLEQEAEKDDTEEVTDDFTVQEKDFKVTIGLVNEDFELKVSDDEQAHLMFSKPKTRDRYEVSFQHNHLVVKRKKSFQNTFFSKRENQKISLAVPRKIEINQLKYDGVNGDALFKDISMKDANLNLVNGDLSINHLAIDQLRIHAVGSDIDLNQLSLTDCHISLVSGDLDANACDVAHDLIISTVSGDLNFTQVFCDLFSINTVSGDVNGKEFYPKSIKFESISGDISIKNKEKSDIKIVKSSSLSGDIDIQ